MDITYLSISVGVEHVTTTRLPRLPGPLAVKWRLWIKKIKLLCVGKGKKQKQKQIGKKKKRPRGRTIPDGLWWRDSTTCVCCIVVCLPGGTTQIEALSEGNPSAVPKSFSVGKFFLDEDAFG